MFTMFMRMVLSLRVLLGSLNPGESIRVILPLFAILTSEVTDINDGDASNLMCPSCLLYFSEYTCDIFVSKVDLP